MQCLKRKFPKISVSSSIQLAINFLSKVTRTESYSKWKGLTQTPILSGILVICVVLTKSTSSSVLRTKSTFPGTDLSLLTILTACGIDSPGAVIGHKMKHALYFKFQFSLIIYESRTRNYNNYY